MPQIDIKKQEVRRTNVSSRDRKPPEEKDVLALVSGEVITSCSLDVLECSVISAFSLSELLNSPEEDEAWKDFNPEM
jgi:hypothetical protein